MVSFISADAELYGHSYELSTCSPGAVFELVCKFQDLPPVLWQMDRTDTASNSIPIHPSSPAATLKRKQFGFNQPTKQANKPIITERI